MRGVNKAIIMGNLGRDPEVRHTQSGTVIANLSVATTESWNDKQTGNKVEKVEWHRVVLFGKLAEVAAQYLKKGSGVYIEGKIQTSKYTDKQGVERYSTEIVVDQRGTMLMVGGNRDQNAGQQHPGAQQPAMPQQQAAAAGVANAIPTPPTGGAAAPFDDSEIPF